MVNKMTSSLLCFILSSVALVAQNAPAPAGKKLVSPKISIASDRVSALYTCRDKAVFTVAVMSEDKLADAGICTIRLSKDGGELISENKYDLAVKNPFSIEAGLDHPGFMRCDFVGLDNISCTLSARATAGFDVEKITMGFPEPADFDQYWSDLLKRQAAIEDAVTCEPLSDSVGKPGYKYFKLTVKTVDDGRVYGFLGVPAENPGPFAAIVLVCGAGSGYDIPDPTFIRPDMMTLSLNIHPIDPTLPKAEFQKKYKEMTAVKPYWLLGAPDRDKFHFRNGILGSHAAVEYLSRHPQFNKKDLLYLSASQGGAFGLFLGGLNQKFSAIAASVPALCDNGGLSPGWPDLVGNVAGNDEKLRRECLDMSAYFDAANFAKRIKCPVIFTVGFNDSTCSPGSVYAAFNAVRSTKYIMTGPMDGHATPWEHLNGIWQWVQNGLDEKNRAYRTYYKY